MVAKEDGRDQLGDDTSSPVDMPPHDEAFFLQIQQRFEGDLTVTIQTTVPEEETVAKEVIVNIQWD